MLSKYQAELAAKAKAAREAKKKAHLTAIIEKVAKIRATDASTMMALRLIWWQEMGQYTSRETERDPLLSVAQFLFEPALSAPIAGFSKRKVLAVMEKCGFKPMGQGSRYGEAHFLVCKGDFSPAPMSKTGKSKSHTPWRNKEGSVWR